MKSPVRFMFMINLMFSIMCAASCAEAADERRPNVLIVMCDQLNAGVLSCYGGPVSTPHIDHIANEGVRFGRAVCPTPFCSPTRASIITGLYPHAHGIVTNIGRHDYPAMRSPTTQEGIQRHDVTTEQLLFAAGYTTHHSGKWHLTDEDLPYYTDMYGEHHEYAAEMADVFTAVQERDPPTWMNWYGWILPVEQSPQFLQTVRLTLPLAQNFDVRVADKTVESIGAADAQPFACISPIG